MGEREGKIERETETEKERQIKRRGKKSTRDSAATCSAVCFSHVVPAGTLRQGESYLIVTGRLNKNVSTCLRLRNRIGKATRKGLSIGLRG